MLACKRVEDAIIQIKNKVVQKIFVYKISKLSFQYKVQEKEIKSIN